MKAQAGRSFSPLDIGWRQEGCSPSLHSTAVGVSRSEKEGSVNCEEGLVFVLDRRIFTCDAPLSYRETFWKLTASVPHPCDVPPT